MKNTIRANRRRMTVVACLIGITMSGRVLGQAPGSAPTMLNLAGPRVGVTMMSSGVVDRLKRERIDIVGVVTQFGWQSESRFYSSPAGISGVTEWILLVGGTEQGQFLPSFTWLMGFRTPEGIEFGVGPNITPLGASLALAGGITYRVGDLNVPLNVALVPSPSGVRLSLLTGFNMGRR